MVGKLKTIGGCDIKRTPVDGFAGSMYTLTWAPCAHDKGDEMEWEKESKGRENEKKKGRKKAQESKQERKI